jgi:DNA-binding NarL/FixJ family response regulator
MPNKPVTIIIADDHPLMTEGLTSIIHSETSYRVTQCIHDGKALLHLLNTQKPTLILLDINMPKINGIEAAKEIRARFPQILIVCISMYTDKHIYTTLKEIGVNGFIPKLSDGKIFTDTITSVLQGNTVFVEEKEEKQQTHPLADSFQNTIKLSTREIEVLRLIKKGLTTKAISESLNLSTHTVDTHRKNICRKLNLTNPNALIKFAFDNEF